MSRQDRLIEDYGQFIEREEAFLRRLAGKKVTRRPPPSEPLVAEFHTLSDGSATHTQELGWRMVVDTLMDRLRLTAEPPPDGSRRDPEHHAEYEALVRRELAYPFLAAWRLSIEVVLKDTLINVYRCTSIPHSSQLRHELRGHDISKLWGIFENVYPQFREAMNVVARRLGIDPDSSGLDTPTSLYSDIVAQLMAIDPDGQSLRYDLDLRGRRNMQDVGRLDLAEVHSNLGDLHYYLGHTGRISSRLSSVAECAETLQRLESDDSDTIDHES